MPVYETFSKRQRKQDREGQPDVYQYDHLPQPFRVQVAHIWSDAIGHGWDEPWRRIHDTLARERGVFELAGPGQFDPCPACTEFLLQAETEGALDIIEIAFRVIEADLRTMWPYEYGPATISEGPEQAIEELNERFGEHGIGYQFVSGQLVRVDSQYVHEEVVKPAIALLHDVGFSGPSDEFMRAHEHYRHGRYKEAVAEALKSFESTMKTICDERGWTCGPNATANALIGVVVQNGLVPPYLESHFAGLRSAMDSGLPTIRNKTSGHGQGATPLDIPAHFAAYALHLAAANIVFLVEAHNSSAQGRSSAP